MNKTRVEVGQVWDIEGQLLMVSSQPTSRDVLVGEAEKRGSSYAMTRSPARIKKAKFCRGTLICDTEAQNATETT